MSDPIPLVLSAAEWANPSDVLDGYVDLDVGIIDIRIGGPGGARDPGREVAALIALLNDALPNSDDRKITRDTIEALRRAARCLREAPHGVSDDWRHMDAGWHNLAGSQRARHEGAALVLEALADALESYLPQTNA
jgi:hypothetical protein